MHKKHMFLRVFSKIAIFACVFCTISAWAETTTCDINYTPVTGNSIQNGTPTPTNPVEIESIGTKIGNKYQISVTAQGNLINENEAYDTNGKCPGVTTRWGWLLPLEIGSYSLRGFFEPTSGIGLYYRLSTDGGATWNDSIASRDKKQLITITQPSTKIVIYGGTSDTSTERMALKKVTLVKGDFALDKPIPYSTPITTPIYLNAPLRKVGDYADVLDYKNGQIIRNVGVKVLDGTENWQKGSSRPNAYLLYLSDFSGLANNAKGLSNYFIQASTADDLDNPGYIYFGSRFNCTMPTSIASKLTEFKSWLTSQYANGTPVTVYYPLATPVVEQIENWSCPVPITDIQIATTKMVDEEFAQAEANLAATVQTIESVVSRTIAQTGQIQVLQDTKQTRPDESCPANMKCLLVQDEDGTPHWYPIIEP